MTLAKEKLKARLGIKDKDAEPEETETSDRETGGTGQAGGRFQQSGGRSGRDRRTGRPGYAGRPGKPRKRQSVAARLAQFQNQLLYLQKARQFDDDE